MKTELQKSNKLMAEFLGVEPTYHGEYEMYGVIDPIEDGEEEQHFFLPENMKFDESWDWLMPVVHKCLEICHNKMLNEWEKAFSERFSTLSIIAMYNEVVEFIYWHNDQQERTI